MVTGLSHDDQRSRGMETTTDQFGWPDDKRVAVVFNVAYEAWSEGGSSTLGPMGNPLPAGTFDTNALSWGAYGAKRGIWRLMDVLAKRDIKATVFVSGCLVERTPETVLALADAGHDICCHGYAQDIIPAMLGEAEERDSIRRCKGLLGDLLGEAPKGWISPRGTPSRRTAALLAEEGFRWHGDCYDDDFAYVENHPAGSIVAVPLTTEVNDLSVCVRHGNPARTMLTVFRDALDARLEPESGPAPGHLDVLGHTHVSGRPLEASVYGEITKIVCARDDVWIATKSEIAERALDQAEKELPTSVAGPLG